MAAIAFDPMEYARMLEDAGVSRDEAEVHAKAMTTAFLHNVDALVTKDYLDVRFNDFGTRVEASFEARFSAMDQRLDGMDERFDRIDQRLDGIDQRLDGIDQRLYGIDQRFASIDVQFARIDGQFSRVNLMLGIIMIAVIYPALGKLFALLA
jgi:hypothetical protein